jgi:transcriptional regulator with XRE-family HTH domain
MCERSSAVACRAYRLACRYDIFAGRIRISQNYLSTMEHGKAEIGAEIVLRIGRELGKSIEWLLAGEG